MIKSESEKKKLNIQNNRHETQITKKKKKKE